jgi:outer membrane protein assembly factor BamB
MTSGRSIACRLALGICSLFATVSDCRGENWPQWRGPDHNGTSRETDIPVKWNATSGVTWRCELPLWGRSTPAIWGNAIFLTSHVDDEKLVLVKIDKQTGKIAWQREVGKAAASRVPNLSKSNEDRGRQVIHKLQNLATPSPTVDADVVIIHFGNGDLAAYDHEGGQLWHRNLQKDYGRYTIWWGHANSPILYKDLVVSACIQDSCRDLPIERSQSYVVAHDKKTGQPRWRTIRATEAFGEPGDAYTTPLLWKNAGNDELLIAGALAVDGYDPATGRRLWFLEGLKGNRMVGGAVIADKTAYLAQGMRNPLIAVQLGNQGKRPESDILWHYDRGTPDSPTPVVWRDLLFFVSDNGIARCLDAKRGTLHWEQRLKGDYLASPLAVDGHIYFVNTKGLTTVVDASKTFKRLAENNLDDEVVAMPIVSDGRLFIRGRKFLFCIGNPN